MSQENEKHVHILEDGTVVEHSHGDHDHKHTTTGLMGIRIAMPIQKLY